MSRPVAELHADWLRLVEPEGQFLSLPVLRRAFPNGLDTVSPAVRARLSEEYPRAQRGAASDEKAWTSWLDWLLGDALAWGPAHRTGDAAIYSHTVPERDIVLRADGALVDPETEKPRVFVVRYPHGTPLNKRLTGERWNASPLDRLALLCRAHDVRIGLLTDGERALLAWIPAQGPGGHAIWETGLFVESRERNLLQSFISLLHASRFFAVRDGDQLEALFEESARAESDVTGRLGFQVRQAVELLVGSLSRVNLESGGTLLAGIAPQRVYEAAATVMMRLVFLLFAEERALLPLDDPLYADSYAASTLREQLDDQAVVEGDEPLERRSAAWFRLLALFRAVYAGLDHDRLRIPPYGGRLFDPDRFPFLEGRNADARWSVSASRPLPIDDLTVRAILEALQTLPIREDGSRERRRLSFRALDVEQIGHIYEGLLDHGAVRVDDVYVGLVGKSGDEAEIPLSDLEQKAQEGEQPLVSFLHDFTGKSEGAVAQMIERGRAIALGRDPDARRLINTSCDNDAALAGRVSPFFHTLRRDLHDLPVVFPPQSLVVKQTRQRRSTGTEYTPRDLAEEMVRYALEPLVYSPGPRDGAEPEQWRLRPSSELLDLKICDPAVGSGAFLVSACRYLGDLVVEAWIVEDPVRAQSDREDLTLEARRTVVDRCLYGVDRDAMAVEMAKLSLWLATMAREKPFSFLDHAIRCGDSLLGITSLDQLRYLHIDPEAGKRVHTSLFDVMNSVQPVIDKAVDLREGLKAFPTLAIRDADEKRRLSEGADRLLDMATVIADGLVATALATAGSSERQRDAAYFEFGARIARALDNATTERKEALQQLHLRTEQMLNAGCPADGPPRPTLHWPLAFADIFARGGFDVVFGNPPFLGGKKITGTLGLDYRVYLAEVIGKGRRGHADLVAYFFLRAATLSKNFAFLAVNTIAQGDTREVGLDALLDYDWKITRAIRSRPWPGAAGVHIAQLWLSYDADSMKAVLDGVEVTGVTALLTRPQRATGNPYPLAANAGTTFIGSYILGMGFTITPETANEMIQEEPRCAEVLFPYLNAEDVCTRPDASASRWVINFFDWPIERAETYGTQFKLIEQSVKPERQRKKGDGTYKLRKPLPQRWWQYADKRPALYRSIHQLDRVVVMPRVSKVVLPLLYPTGTVFSDSLAVIARNDYLTYGVLSSTIHRDWVRQRGSTLETRTRYTPSDCFETFPFPAISSVDVGEIMKVLDRERREIMLDREIGLTSLYNQVNNSTNNDDRISVVRKHHANLDRVVCKAFGWGDLDLKYDFYETDDEGVRWTICSESRAEILDRLLELNHERHREELERGLISGGHVAGNGKRRRDRDRAAEDASLPLRIALEDHGQTRVEL